MTEALPQRRGFISPVTADRIIMGCLFAIDVLSMMGASAGRHVKSPELSLWELLVAAFNAGVFWWRTTRPVMVFALSLLAIVLASAGRHGVLVSQYTGMTAIFASYAVGAWAPLKTRNVWLPAAVFLLLFAVLLRAGLGLALSIAPAIIALPWVTGYAVRSRRLYVDAVESRLAAAERERDERAHRAVRDERAHIARELHDIVAHHVSVIGVQAGAARMSLQSSPADASAALQVIEESSRQAVGEMRHLLSALRDTDDVPPGTEPPQPGLADIGRLVESFRSAGLDVDVASTRGDQPLPPTIDLCCYRIVEEALTNIIRHSTARQARVEIAGGPGEIDIRISDAGPPAPPNPGSGRGHVGMRERVGLFGGSLQIGPDAGGGFVVDAKIPIPLEQHS